MPPIPSIPLSPVDAALSHLGQALKTVFGSPVASRPSPALGLPQALDELPQPAQRLSGALMRVNHVGEVCAQALYQAQAISARSAPLRVQMEHAAKEEGDHLAWTAQRLRELGDRPSVLNPLWYAGAFALGLVAGRLGDAVSLGFVVETERQVEAHLAGHLQRLPEQDHRSRAIVAQMQADEAAHGAAAREAGASELPAPARWLMGAAAKVMTTTAHVI